jgi:hypothetical protein
MVCLLQLYNHMPGTLKGGRTLIANAPLVDPGTS